MTPSETDIEQRDSADQEAPAQPEAPATEDTAENPAPAAPDAPVVPGAADAAAAESPADASPAPEAPASETTDTPAAETPAPDAPPADAPAADAPPADAPAAQAITAEGATAEAPADGTVPAPTADAPARTREARPPRRSRHADRRKQLEEQSRATAAELGREPDRKVVEKAILAAGGPDAVRDFMATPQESREGKPLGWRIACLREARRHDAGGRAEEGWVTLSAVPVRQIRGALDRAVDADGRIMFRDEAPSGRGGGGRGGPRRGGDRRPGGRDERAVADQFMEGGVATFGDEDTRKRNPFAALDGLLEDEKKK